MHRGAVNVSQLSYEGKGTPKPCLPVISTQDFYNISLATVNVRTFRRRRLPPKQKPNIVAGFRVDGDYRKGGFSRLMVVNSIFLCCLHIRLQGFQVLSS